MDGPYSRQLILPGFGPAAQANLGAAHLVCVGAGGLGSPALQYLAAAGIGQLTVVDGDTVAESNLHRQILFGAADVGLPKAALAAERLSTHSGCACTAVNEPITAANAAQLLSDADLVLDGSDNFATRYLVNDACVLLGKPLVWGAVYQYEGQASVFNWPAFAAGETPKSPNLRCLFPTQPDAASMPSCADAGVLGTLAGTVGTLLATEAIKVLTGIGQPLSGRLWQYDALTCETTTLHFRPDPDNPLFTGAISAISADRYTDAACKPVPTLSPAEFARQAPTSFLLDVRQPWEHAAGNLGGQLIPLDQLPGRLDALPRDRPLLVYCQKGQRSAAAVHLLTEAGFATVYSLAGGIEAYDAFRAAPPVS